MKTPISTFLLSIFVFSTIIGCKKVAELTSDAQVAQDVATLGKVSNNLQNIVAQTVQSKSVTAPKTKSGSDIEGAIITVDSSDKLNWVYTVNFDGSVIGSSGVSVSGVMTVKTNGKKFGEDGMIANVTSKGLIIDGIKFNDDLSIVLTNTETKSGYEETWKINQEFTMILANGKSVVTSGEGFRYQTAGFKTLDNYSDDAFKAEITSNGTASNGVTFDLTTTSLLIKNADCKYISGGTLNWNSNGINKIIDFGNGSACDNTAIITVDGVESKVTF